MGVKDVQGDAVLVHYMNGERDDEWVNDQERIFNGRGDEWCKHGKVCNRASRGTRCRKHNPESADGAKGCKFCHDPACANAGTNAVSLGNFAEDVQSSSSGVES